MKETLKKLWACWISDRAHRRPMWKTYVRLLTQVPVIPDGQEEETYYKLYRGQIERGNYRSEPKPRGRWVGNNWVMSERT
jgi:hypothetical protein